MEVIVSYDRTLLPDWMQPHWIGRDCMIMVNGHVYSFVVLEASLHEQQVAPRFFCGYDPARGTPPFISAEVPEWIRPHAITHEIIEMTKFNGQPQACQRAVDYELQGVPPSMRETYIAFRIKMFTELVDCAQNGGQHLFTEAQRAEFQQTLEYLQGKLRQPAA